MVADRLAEIEGGAVHVAGLHQHAAVNQRIAMVEHEEESAAANGGCTHRKADHDRATHGCSVI